MDGCCPEHADTLSLAFLPLEPLCLYDDAQALDEENAAQDREQQLLMDDDGANSDDAADGQGAGVTHEYLGGIGIVPKETDHGSDECR